VVEVSFRAAGFSASRAGLWGSRCFLTAACRATPRTAAAFLTLSADAPAFCRSEYACSIH
jgi:hypothetical protein